MRAHHGRPAVFAAHCGIGLHVCALRRTHAERYIYSITSMACTNEAFRLAARLIIYSGDENAMRPERSCSELDLIPLLDKVMLEIRELKLFKEFRLVELQPRILRAHLKFKKRGLRKSRSASRPKPAHPYGGHTTTQAHPCREYGGCLPHHYLAFQFLQKLPRFVDFISSFPNYDVKALIQRFHDTGVGTGK
jgi:hypothetical protein